MRTINARLVHRCMRVHKLRGIGAERNLGVGVEWHVHGVLHVRHHAVGWHQIMCLRFLQHAKMD